MPKVWKDLDEDVVKPGFCLGCGACVATCPVQCLALERGRAVLVTTCINCGICYGQCPETVDLDVLRKSVFPETNLDPVGDYLKVLSVEAKSADIKKRAQSGGAVTAIVSPLLEYDYIDAAIVTGMGPEPWSPVCKVATTTEQLLDCAGSKYTRGPIYPSIYDAVRRHYRKRLAVIGLPLHIVGTRRTEISRPTNAHLADAIKLRIGIFCSGAFTYDFFKKIVEGEKKIPLSDVKKFDVKGGKVLAYLDQKTVQEIPLNVARRFMDLPCRICPDYSAEVADIAVGDVGTAKGKSTVLIRTKAGDEALEFARKSGSLNVVPVSADAPVIEEIRRQAKEKKESARKELESLKTLGKTLPSWMKQT